MFGGSIKMEGNIPPLKESKEDVARRILTSAKEADTFEEMYRIMSQLDADRVMTASKSKDLAFHDSVIEKVKEIFNRKLS